MRVLHVAKANGIGGSERHLFTLLPGLRDRGIDVGMCVLAEGAAQRFVEPLQRLGVPVVSRPAGPNENPLLVPVIARQIRRFRPDLVHTHLLHADLYGLPAARWLGIPAVRSVHRTVGRRGYVCLERLVGPLAGCTIAISDEVARFVSATRLATRDRLRTVRYGIDTAPFAATPQGRTAARAALGFGPDEVSVGIASRLVPGKGHAFLIEAVAAAHRKAGAIRLHVAGDGVLGGELRRRASRLLPPGVATFHGHVTDIGTFLAACDVLVFPTLPEFGEGFGLAALEAMAAGCPVVATPMGGLPDMVVDGVTGMLVAPGDVDQLAAALVGLAEDAPLRTAMGAHAAARARREFSADAMVAATVGIYEELLAAPRRGPSVRIGDKPIGRWHRR
jgi:glycosyltransferase involved in cell wall biosynthesis